MSDQSRGPGHRLGLGECDDRQHAPAASRQIQPKLRGRRGQRDAAPGPQLEAMSMAARIRACPAQRWRVCQLGQRRPLYLQGTRPFRDQAAPAMARLIGVTCQRNAKMSPVSATPRCPLLSGQCVAAIMPGRLSGSVEAPLSRPGLEHRRPWGGTKGEERSGATRSHAQRVFQREHGEDGERRTFPEVSTAWHSDGQPVGRAITRPRPALVVPR